MKNVLLVGCLWLLSMFLYGPACSGDGDGNGNGEECNNGVLDPSEACDPGIASGEGACPTSCPDDGDPCTTVLLVGSAEDCTARCETQNAQCADSDGCCPDGCNNNNDDDCPAECGNGVIEEGEICDGDCPGSCPSSDPCQVGNLLGSAADCDAECQFDPVTECLPDDNCCPEGCDNLTDSDCRGEIGDACTADSQCTSRMCATADGYALPGGFCTLDCTANPSICGTEAHCGVERFGLRFCNKSCSQDDECRTAEGYVCRDADGDGSKECSMLATGSGEVGDACNTHLDCAGEERGACVAPENASAADGYCTIVLCDDSQGSCPTGSHCALMDAQNLGFCLKTCQADGECRNNGYACYDADADGASECWIAGTGDGAVGAECSLPTDCGGGAFFFCYTFWQGGYCTANCTPGVGTDCPANSNCYSFGPFSSCLDSCDSDADCRTGYACVDFDSQDGKECMPE